MKPAYQLQEIVFGYNQVPVLTIEELDIQPGELVALVGPNGAGKTTLLHLMAFIATPQNGEIFFFGEGSRKSNAISFRRRVGLLLQNPFLFHESVLSNITWGLRLRGVPRRKLRGMAEEALDRVGLAGFEEREARALSGGESQRVALARALVLDPEVLLLDEPTNHMDQTSVERIEETVQKMNRGLGKTVIFSSHDPQERERMAPDRVINIVAGKLNALSD